MSVEHSPSGSFDELAIPLFERLCSFAHWLTHSREQAEDLEKTAYTGALESISSLQRGTKFRNCVHRILQNTFFTCRDLGRWERRPSSRCCLHQLRAKIIHNSRQCNGQSGSMQDSVLIGEAQGGNHAAFEQLVHAHDHAVLRLAFRITGSQSAAQDIYQKVFLSAYKQLGSLPLDCSFSTWIYRFATTACLNYLRKKNREHSAREVKVEGDERALLNRVSNEGSMNGLEEQPLRREGIEQILFALHRLTPRERMVLELKHSQGLKLRTVSEILDMSDRSVATTLFRATRKVRFIWLGSPKETKL